ncbi:hypothetical protein CB0940_11524 [Cercospora beticola]|uniref:Zn(2)-C6 fungal-type domain-containing protein n=1 Tax=Cercospora beticola TaxID=122368 RepID=A0A2G5HE66_CERBT|nr:hypothetical protein CB0940_11524 [Cercospora beticola]PIA90563.1 hypothetical protein CB0940_11524 [Cercospora beticola]WPB08392.1 hypothetical protein RHO25_013058 [Cercospora beticola]CAK1367711.1 unnamed protein product [Cercospora beticola]
MSTPTIKYRAACDHCSATKIKCTQERPSCARCRTLGRDCNYSRSLRAGKPPRSSQGLNKRIANAPVLPRRGPAADSPQPVNGGPLGHGLPAQIAYPISGHTPKTEPAWSATSSPYPSPPDMRAYGSAEPTFFQDIHTADNSSVNTPMEPEWFFDFTNASLPSESPLVRVDSREPTQQPSPMSDTRHPVCLPQSADAKIYPNELNNMSQEFIPNSPTPPGVDQCLRTATETLNRLYEIPYAQIDHETKQYSVDQVLSSTSRAVQICHDLISCPCVKDFHLPIAIATLASKVLTWYQTVACIRDPNTEMPNTNGKVHCREVVVDEQLALGAYKLDGSMGWVLKNHIILGQIQRLKEVADRFDAQFCTESSTKQMVGGGKLYSSMGNLLKSRLQFTLRELETRLKGSSS